VKESQFDRFVPGVLGVVGLTLCAVTAAVTVSGSSSDHAVVEAIVRVLTVATPIAVGLYAVRRPMFERFGWLLVAAGVGWFLTTLSNASDPVLYSIGRVAGWAVEPLLVYLVLAFPSGRLETRTDRVLVWTTVLLVLTLYLPTALLVEDYPVPAPWTSCDAGCPGNAFMLTSSEPGVIDDVVRPLREIATLMLFAATALRLAYRTHVATRPLRRTLAPVLGAASFRFAAYFVVLLGRRLAPESQIVAVSVWLIAVTIPILALAFLVGLARWWLFIAVSTQRLGPRLRGYPGPYELQRALAEVFDDPGLVVVYRHDDGYWTDREGHRMDQTSIASGRCLTEVGDGDRVVAAIIHDTALGRDEAFINTATSYALLTLDNHRLSAQSHSLLREVQESRARILAAADEERRHIERDLHDGAQQRIIALRIKLELAAEETAGHDEEHAVMLREFGSDVEAALEEVQALARGIYPAVLADHGLVEGLRFAALRSPLPTSVLGAGIQRYTREVESAAYFCCLEALQNAAKHATGATGAVVELSDDGTLHLEVRDDGAGFDPGAVKAGSGFVNMRDRVEAVGGELAIASVPGHGTRVTAHIPLASKPP
jgi:signal transduction histidine kinase